MRSYGTAIRRGSERVFRHVNCREQRQDVGTPLMITVLHHVNITIPAELEAAAKEFYGLVLGLRQIPKPAASRQTGAWYQIGDNQLHLSVEDGEPARLSSRHVCFTVSDLAEAEEKFRDAGVEIIPDPRPVPGTARFYVRDPGGNLFEIAQQR